METIPEKNIEILIRARYPLIYVVSFEEMRVIHALTQSFKQRNKQLLLWSITQGVETPDGSYLTEFKDPIKVLEYILQMDINGVFVLQDFHPYMNDPVIIRKLRDLGHALKLTMKNVLFLSPILKIPGELEKEIAVIDYKLPGKEELGGSIRTDSRRGGKCLCKIAGRKWGVQSKNNSCRKRTDNQKIGSIGILSCQ